MTVRIGGTTTEIEAHDAQQLRIMADRVVSGRPSFRRVAGRVGDETVEIYTRRRGTGQRLAVRGPRTRIELDRRNRRALYQLLADTH